MEIWSSSAVNPIQSVCATVMTQLKGISLPVVYYPYVTYL